MIPSMTLALILINGENFEVSLSVRRERKTKSNYFYRVEYFLWSCFFVVVEQCVTVIAAVKE